MCEASGSPARTGGRGSLWALQGASSVYSENRSSPQMENCAGSHAKVMCPPISAAAVPHICGFHFHSTRTKSQAGTGDDKCSKSVPDQHPHAKIGQLESPHHVATLPDVRISRWLGAIDEHPHVI